MSESVARLAWTRNPSSVTTSLVWRSKQVPKGGRLWGAARAKTLPEADKARSRRESQHSRGHESKALLSREAPALWGFAPPFFQHSPHEMRSSPRVSSLGQGTRGALLIARRILRELVRTRRALFMWGVFPLLMLLLFGTIYSSGGGSARSFDRTAPGILTGAAMFFSCLGGPISILVAERQGGTLRRLLVSPLPGSAYFVGVVLAFSVVALLQAAIVYLVARAFGGHYHGSYVLGLSVLLLSVIAYTGIGFLFGVSWARRAEDVTGPVSAVGVPLLVLGGTFFPVSNLPPSLLWLAHLNPVFYMNETLKAVWADGKSISEVGSYFATLVGFALAALLLGALSHRRLLRAESR